MSWIDALDEYGYNVVVDELAWHLYEGREPIGVVKRTAPEPGVEFEFADQDGAFLSVTGSILDANWEEAIGIVREFPQLQSFVFRDA